ncbi:MAG: hypothetical protein K6G79_03825 [Bacteroidales bacterium]|nr:hypothetical protein [Bacteroidales bacterium]
MKKILYLLAGLLMLCACEQETSHSLVPDITSMTFGPDGGEFTSVIFTNGIWKATCDDKSVTFAPDSGDYTLPMHIKVAPNEEHYTKSIKISLTSKLGTTTRNGKIAITQTCRPFIICDKPSMQMGAEGGIARFEVNSNEPWSLVSKALDGSGPGPRVYPESGLKNRIEVDMEIPANDSGKARTFTAVLALDSDRSRKVELMVEQVY